MILGDYTVYLDLWLCDLSRRVIARGRRDRYPSAIGRSVADAAWFRPAAVLPDGDSYVAGAVARHTQLGNAQLATYCAGVRENGVAAGKPLGVLAIHFDWELQARAIVQGVRVAPGDRDRIRVLLIDGHRRILAGSDEHGILSETLSIDTVQGVGGAEHGDGGSLRISSHAGFGVIVQPPASAAAITP